MTAPFHFQPVDQEHLPLVHRWLGLAHVAEWFYGEGLQNTLTHLDDFLKGGARATYWLGFDRDRPFAFLITASIQKPDDALAKWCSKPGAAITLDLLIGDTDYLGKGLCPLVIQQFLLSQFPKISEVLIDPEVANTRAIHIYKKVGFTIVGEFAPSYNSSPHYMMRLDMNKLSKYVFESYDPLFVDLFLKEKQRILAGNAPILEIEHVGSTAIPGLGGKGIIDIAILAKKDDVQEVKTSLQKLGYEFREGFSTKDRLYFITYLPDGKKGSRRYHIHLTYPGCPIWNQLIHFRDCLICHRDIREEYAAIKEKAVQNHVEGEEYRKIKDPFIKKVLALRMPHE